jgi:hypothetical protein
VPHWPADRATVTLQHIVVHVFGDTARHAGHADILREAADGAAGLSETGDKMPSTEPAFWAAHVARVEAAAVAAQAATQTQASAVAAVISRNGTTGAGLHP